MSATANSLAPASGSGPEVYKLKSKLKTTWSTGDYDRFSRFMQRDAEKFYERLSVPAGASLLDVGCGAGQLALIAARSGARVTACDIAPNWLAAGRARAAAEDLSVTFEEGDAEALPYRDAQFDFVVSLIGAMFAPRPELVAAELTRVCKPGGTVAMANWTPTGFIGLMFKTIAKHIAPSGMPSPALWGDEATVRARLHDGISDLQLSHQFYHFDYPFSPDEVVEFFRANYGPMTQAFASLDAGGQDQLRTELTQLWAAHNKAAGNSTKVEAEYLQVVAMRSASIGSSEIKIQNVEGTMTRRAAALADRIEEGANQLAEFAEGLSDAEWRSPGSPVPSDRRTVGVIVHHVASVYPIEVDLAKAIGSGKAVTEVTWEAVANLNSGHAKDHGGTSKADTIALLRRNSKEAAAAVRNFTDEQLDSAAPFSLSFGAPVTAQFVIEDHALRHSWHHLARIRKSLGR